MKKGEVGVKEKLRVYHSMLIPYKPIRPVSMHVHTTFHLNARFPNRGLML